jgi:hypothetical protein
MNRKRLTELQDGVIVKDDVKAVDGSIVVASGTVLSAAVRRKLRKANIVTIAVTEESAGLADLIAEVDEERPPERRISSRTRFMPRDLDGTATTSRRKTTSRGTEKKKAASETTLTQQRLLRVAVMFSEYRDDELMRELCRLAIKSAKEGWVGG